MQTCLIQATPKDHIIRLPADMEIPALGSGVYALAQPDSQEWTVTLMTPVSAAELARWPELQCLITHVGGCCVPQPSPHAARHLSHPASRPCHLRVLP